MLYYDRINISEGIDLAKSNNRKKCMSFHYWFLIRDSTLLFFFAIYKMVDNKYSLGTYKPVKTNIVTVMRNPEMLRFVLDHLKTKNRRKHAVKILGNISIKICS